VSASDRPTPAASEAVGRGEPADAVDGDEDHHLVDWARTGRRLRRQAVILGTLVLVAWVVVAVRDGGLSGRTLAELVGVGVLLAIAAEIVIVGGAALRGMLAAGERGERLAQQDVSLLPPQVTRRLRRHR
jgi:hypothetical protein